MPVRPIAAACIALAAALVLSACSPRGGGEPASLSLYSGRDEELIQPLIEMFEEETGIAVEVRYGDTGEMAALLLEEGSDSPADAFLSQDAGALGALSDAGAFEELPADLTARVEAGFSSADSTWVGVTGRGRVIVYDGETFDADDVPTTVDDFTEPEWAGRFGIAPGNASFQAFVTAYRVLKGEAAAEQWLAGIAANQPQIFDNNRAILAAVNDGVLDAGLINHYYWYGLADEVGADNMRAQIAFPEVGDPGSIVNVTGAGVLHTGAEDDDALTFLRFLVSERAQAYFVEQVHEYPLVAGVPAPEGLPALESLMNPDLDLADLASLAQTQKLLADYGLL